MKRLIIAGGGVSGLIASHIFTNVPGLDVKLLEPNRLGGEFLMGGLKYIHRTPRMEWLFDDLGVPYSPYTIQGGILLRGKVLPHPKCFQDMRPDEVERIQYDHYRKTRRTQPGPDAKKSMNDPASIKPRRALRCDFTEMVTALTDTARVIKKGVVKITPKALTLSDGTEMEYDYLVLTIPLWIIKRIAYFHVPDGMAMRLNIAKISPRVNSYAKWDYVYTPYTPDDTIHRISPDGSSYVVETNGELNIQKLQGDLSFLFRQGWYMEDLKEGLKGHLHPLMESAEWPENVAPLGRFAKWDTRATTDVTIEDAIELAGKWFGEWKE